MCGRYGLAGMSWERISEVLGQPLQITEASALVSRFNIAPTQDAPVVRRGAERLEGSLARWDLIPRWWNKPLEEKRLATFNARVETVAEKPMFRDAVRHRRCLVPASYFIEWRTEEGGKQPYRIGRADGGLMMLAGVWDRWSGMHKGNASQFESFSILVGQPNPLVARLHNRMPVILQSEDWLTWLEGGLDEALGVAGVFPSQLMTAVPIDRAINSSRVEGPDREDLVSPLGPPLEAVSG